MCLSSRENWALADPRDSRDAPPPPPRGQKKSICMQSSGVDLRPKPPSLINPGSASAEWHLIVKETMMEQKVNTWITTCLLGKNWWHRKKILNLNLSAGLLSSHWVCLWVMVSKLSQSRSQSHGYNFNFRSGYMVNFLIEILGHNLSLEWKALNVSQKNDRCAKFVNYYFVSKTL